MSYPTVRHAFYAVVLLFCLPLCAFGNLTDPPTKVSYTIQFANLKSSKGKVHAAIFPSAQGWPEDSKHALATVVLPITNKQAKWELSLPPGSYAIAAYQDENSNNEMDYNFVGIPVEPYGFSNNVRPGLSAPSFEKAAFSVNKSAPKKHTITLK